MAENNLVDDQRYNCHYFCKTTVFLFIMYLFVVVVCFLNLIKTRSFSDLPKLLKTMHTSLCYAFLFNSEDIKITCVITCYFSLLIYNLMEKIVNLEKSHKNIFQIVTIGATMLCNMQLFYDWLFKYVKKEV
jgi:hypothetical protein